MGLEWLKDVLGEAYNEDVDKKISDEIGKGFVARSDFNALNETKKQLDGQIKDRDKQLDDLKKIDAEGLQAEIARLQEANVKAQSDYDAQLKQIKLDSAIDTKLREAKAVNTKAVKALLDHDKISLDGDNLIGIDDQLKTLQESEKWAFAPAKVGGAGGNPPPTGGEGKHKFPTGTVIF